MCRHRETARTEAGNAQNRQGKGFWGHPELCLVEQGREGLGGTEDICLVSDQPEKSSSLNEVAAWSV